MIFRKILIFRKCYFPERKITFKCLVAFQKMLWKIFSDVWLYGWKCYFPTNFSHANSTHGSKLRQSKATTTKTPPPQQKSKSHRNQNHTEREIGGSKIGGSKARSRGGEIEGAIGVVWSSDWSSQDRLVHAIGANWSSGASSSSRSLSRSGIHLKWK